MIGGNVINFDYQIVGTDGEIHNYVWDDQLKKMVEGKREKEIPWWQLHQIADKLGGELKKLFIQDSNGRKYYRIVIEYEEEKE